MQSFRNNILELSQDPQWDSNDITKKNFEALNVWLENTVMKRDNMVSSNILAKVPFSDPAYAGVPAPTISQDMKYRAMYNPWMAGQQLAMISMGLAFDGGLNAMDSIAQTRMILHYYNAFRIKGIIKEPIPLLETLTDALSRSKSLWVGGRPTKPGQFLKGFLLAWGYNIKDAANIASHFAMEDYPKVINYKGAWARELIPPSCSDILTTFRIMAKNDFSDLAMDSKDGYAVMMDEIKTIVAREMPLLSLNLFVVGKKFLEIWNTFLDEMGLMPKLKTFMEQFAEKNIGYGKTRRNSPYKESEENVRYCYETWLLQQLLGFCDREPGKISEKGELQLKQAAAIMERLVKELDSSPSLRFKL
jgi:hypothetical protein